MGKAQDIRLQHGPQFAGTSFVSALHMTHEVCWCSVFNASQHCAYPYSQKVIHTVSMFLSLSSTHSTHL